MSVSVVVPRSPGSCSYRDAAWAWLKRRWAARHPTWEVVEGVAPAGPWSKGAAVASALETAGGQVLVVCDADSFLDPSALTRAVAAVETGAAWVVPYNSVRRLTPAVTDRLLDQDPAGPHDLPTSRKALARAPYSSRPGGGCLVLTAATYQAVGGFDPRFTGWGGEDISLGWALRTLVGPHTRIRADLWHLWHPPHPDRKPGGRSRTATNDSLAGRYRDADGDPAAMRALIEERDPCPQPHST